MRCQNTDEMQLLIRLFADSFKTQKAGAEYLGCSNTFFKLLKSGRVQTFSVTYAARMWERIDDETKQEHFGTVDLTSLLKCADKRPAKRKRKVTRTVPKTSSQRDADCKQSQRFCTKTQCRFYLFSEKDADCALYLASHHPPMTLEQIGAYFGVTRERIRQIERQALRKMRERGVQLEDYLEEGGGEVNVA